MSDSLPRFAFVGAVNPGKTSVLATLLEEDGLRISRVPGETMETQRFELRGLDGRPLIAFYDTPGFQNPRAALAKLKALQTSGEAPLATFRKFLARHGADPAFTDETRLLAPILEGAGIIYVADAAQPPLPINDDELEILRLTGQPLLALLNATGEPLYRDAWMHRLRVHCRVWKFNAHHAVYADRVALLRTLLGLEQAWGPALEQALAALEADWQTRLADAAAVIAELLRQAIRCTVEGAGEDAAARARLTARYREEIRQMEQAAQQRLIRVFKHRHVSVGGGAFAFEQDLFSEKTWEVLGLSRAQLVWAGAITGGLAGAGFDAAFLGHGLGIPTLLGGAAGAASAYFGGEQLTKIEAPLPDKLRLLFGRRTLGGTALRIGPNRHPNFPWVLLDRALLTARYLLTRPHARQEKVTLDLACKEDLSTHWPEETRAACVRIFARWATGKEKPQDEAELRAAIAGELAKRSENAGRVGVPARRFRHPACTHF